MHKQSHKRVSKKSKRVSHKRVSKKSKRVSHKRVSKKSKRVSKKIHKSRKSKKGSKKIRKSRKSKKSGRKSKKSGRKSKKGSKKIHKSRKSKKGSKRVSKKVRKSRKSKKGSRKYKKQKGSGLISSIKKKIAPSKSTQGKSEPKMSSTSKNLLMTNFKFNIAALNDQIQKLEEEMDITKNLNLLPKLNLQLKELEKQRKEYTDKLSDILSFAK